jgi:hypothetical protein
MQEEQIRQNLIYWTVTKSKVRDLRLRGFAQELCLNYKEAEGGVTLTQNRLAEMLGISSMSVWRYTQALMDTGEWDITTATGRPTTYKPTFKEEAVIGREQHGS